MRSHVFPGIAAALLGCGRLDFADRRGLDAGPEIDAFGTCDPTAPFGVPVAITELNDPTQNDGTLRLLPDELSGYFWSYRGATSSSLYLATRADLASPFTIAPVQGLNIAGNQLDPTTTSDGSLLVFRHNSPGDNLYEATRVTPDTFAAPTAITNLNTASTVQPFLPLSGNEMFFSSSRTGGGDLYRTVRTGTTFSAPTQVTELSTTSDEGDPVLAPDGLTLYFRSDRAATPAGYNIYVAMRPTVADPFGAAQLVPNVNSDSDDGPSWISPDGCRLYISSARAGTNDIYVASRTH